MVEVANDGQIAFRAQLDVAIRFAPAAVAVDVEEPDAASVDADGADAVAVPVAGHGPVARVAELEDVVDQVGTQRSLGGAFERA